MRREATVPIGVWLPGVVAVGALLLLWRGRDAAAPRAEVEARSLEVVLPSVEIAPPPIEVVVPRVEPAVPPAVPQENAPPPSSPAESSRRDASIPPFHVELPSGDERRTDALVEFRQRFERELLAPARLDAKLRATIEVTIGVATTNGGGAPSSSAERLYFASDVDDSDLHAALAAEWLRRLVAESGRPPPPAWWLDGAVEIARHPTLEAALSTPKPLALSKLFEPFEAPRGGGGGGEPADRAAWAASCGSFAAFCLGAAGADRHLRETWLEFARPAAPLPGDDGKAHERLASELAARFGCTLLEELEARWAAARRR